MGMNRHSAHTYVASSRLAAVYFSLVVVSDEFNFFPMLIEEQGLSLHQVFNADVLSIQKMLTILTANFLRLHRCIYSISQTIPCFQFLAMSIKESSKGYKCSAFLKIDPNSEK